MIIKKFLHSCILIEEENKRLLIDPGAFSFADGTLKPQDIGPVDVVVITHRHVDHCDVEALKALYALKPFSIVANSDVGAVLTKDGFNYETIRGGEKGSVGGFMIESIIAPHELIPSESVSNSAYLINDKFLHTGDSLTISGLSSCDVLALPVAGPWLKLVEAIELAYLLKPRIVIPIHDWIIKDIMLERIYAMCKAKLETRGIEFKPLGLGEKLDI